MLRIIFHHFLLCCVVFLSHVLYDLHPFRVPVDPVASPISDCLARSDQFRYRFIHDDIVANCPPKSDDLVLVSYKMLVKASQVIDWSWFENNLLHLIPNACQCPKCASVELQDERAPFLGSVLTGSGLVKHGLFSLPLPSSCTYPLSSCKTVFNLHQKRCRSCDFVIHYHQPSHCLHVISPALAFTLDVAEVYINDYFVE